MKNLPINDLISEISYDKKGKTRKQLIVLDFTGKKWKEKETIIKDELIKNYGKSPPNISIIKRSTKKNKYNIDGLRVLVRCNWLKKQRHYDYRGKFNLGTLFKAINKEIIKWQTKKS